MSFQLLAVRHAQAIPNVPELYNSQPKRLDREYQLTNLGQSQSKELGQWLGKAVDFREESWIPVTSEFVRAKQTWHFTGRQQTPHEMKAFNEHDWGAFMGQNEASEEERCAFESKYDKEIDLKAPGGESTLDVYNRVLNGLTQLKSYFEGENYIIVMHGRSLLALRMILEGIPSTDEGWQFILRSASELENCGMLYYPHFGKPFHPNLQEVASINPPYMHSSLDQYSLQPSLGCAWAAEH